MPMYSSYSHRSQNRLLVGCLTILIGGPLLCCFVMGLFYIILPALEGTQTANFPFALVLFGLGALLVLLAGAIMVFVYLRKKRASNISS